MTTAEINSELGGATFTVFRLRKRSTMSASARMEQAISGQMGQPAACMIESKEGLRRALMLKRWRDYGGGAELSDNAHGA